MWFPGSDSLGEEMWKFAKNLFTCLDHFSAPVALRELIRRREVDLISVRIGCGRVPSANPNPLTEIRTCIGNYPGRLPGQFEILFGLPDSLQADSAIRSHR